LRLTFKGAAAARTHNSRTYLIAWRAVFPGASITSAGGTRLLAEVGSPWLARSEDGLLKPLYPRGLPPPSAFSLNLRLISLVKVDQTEPRLGHGRPHPKI